MDNVRSVLRTMKCFTDTKSTVRSMIKMFTPWTRTFSIEQFIIGQSFIMSTRRIKILTVKKMK